MLIAIGVLVAAAFVASAIAVARERTWWSLCNFSALAY
jgi:hypothetical protein